MKAILNRGARLTVTQAIDKDGALVLCSQYLIAIVSVIEYGVHKVALVNELSHKQCGLWL